MAIKLGDALVMIGGDRSKLKQDFKGAEQDTRSWVPKIGGILENMLGGLLRVSVQKLTGAVAAFGKQLLGTVAQAAKVTAVTNTFERLVEVVGGDAVKAMDDLRFATRGMVSDSDLMAASNKFLSMGIATTMDEATKLSEVATQLGTAMGEDAADSMENFALMMANQSIPRLDSFGISSAAVRSRIEELQEATEGLSREAAFNTAVMEQAQVAMKKVGEQGNTAAASLNKINAGWKNITTAMGTLFLPIAEKVLGWVGDFLTYLAEVFQSGDTLNDWLTHLPEFLRPVAEAFGEAVVFLKEHLIPAITFLFEAFEKLMGGDIYGFLWGIHDALVALGVPEEFLVKLENVLVTLWSAFKDLKEGNIEEFIGKIKAVLLELGIPIEIIDKLEAAFRGVYGWLEENVPKIEALVKQIWEVVLLPALEGLLELIEDLLPVALLAFGGFLFVNFVLPMLLAALPVIALVAALLVLGLMWREYGDQVTVILNQLGAVIAHFFGQAIEWVVGLLEAISSLGVIGGSILAALGLPPDFVENLEKARQKLQEYAQARADAAIAAQAATGGEQVNIGERMATWLEMQQTIQRSNTTIYGGVQQYGMEQGEGPLDELWAQGLAG